jgi:diguanylate cyclase (GGDEF)-like protein
MSPDEQPLSPPDRAWIVPLCGCALVLGVALAGLMGWLPRLGAHLDFTLGGVDLALAVLALGPLAFYALTLERGKAAPALRSALAPWMLFADLYVCVQVSGGLLSPLWSAYPLLTLLVARNAGALNAAVLAGTATVLEAFPLWMQAHATDAGGPGGGDFWPRGIALVLPVLGLALGALSRGARPESADPASSVGATQRLRATGVTPSPAAPAAPSPVTAAIQAPSASPPSSSFTSSHPSGAPASLGLVRMSDEAALDHDLLASLEMAFHAHPAWNALSLWWGDAAGLTLKQVLMRQGRPVSEAKVGPGDGFLGLAMRERKLLNIVPLSASAELPYAQPPYRAGALHVLPLEDEGSLLGLLVCDKTGPEGFDAHEAAALNALGRVLVGHAQRVAQLVRLRAEGGRTQMLYAATKALNVGLEKEALLERFGELLGTLVPCDSWALGMREDENAALERLAGSGYRDDAPRALSLDRAGALAATLRQSEGAVLFNSELGAQVPAILLEGLTGHPRHFLLAPLRLQGRLTGVLKLDRAFLPFSEEERDTAYIFASQASSTLENARLYALHKQLATTDGLTGLYNHRYFQERLAVELDHALRSGRPLSLALTDIDFFKKFNDTFGHQEGDVVLRKVADLLKNAGRPGKDVVCRYGGEEFVAILPDCDVVEARQLMDKLRADCAAHLSGGNGEQSQGITLSIGISTYPTAAREQRDLIHVADEALYRAKHAGRNRVCSFKDV